MADIDLYAKVQASGSDPLLAYIGLVKRVALHLKTRLPQVMELDELIQVGIIGLIEAQKVFDQTKGVEFELFARTRIRGAILDEVRRLSTIPRSAVSHLRSHNQAFQELATTLGRSPTQAELADKLGINVEEFQKERAHAHWMRIVDGDTDDDELNNVPGSDSVEPEKLVSEADFMDSLTDAIEGLPERDRLVMALYYNEEMTLKEIGAVLGVSESRVSQILASNVTKLRSILDT